MEKQWLMVELDNGTKFATPKEEFKHWERNIHTSYGTRLIDLGATKRHYTIVTNTNSMKVKISPEGTYVNVNSIATVYPIEKSVEVVE